MAERVQYFVTEPPKPLILLRRTGGVDEAFFPEGGWQPTKTVIDFMFGHADNVAVISEQSARAAVPAAFVSDEWAERRRAERQREIAAGEGRRWNADQPRPSVASSSKTLRRFEAARQRLQVLCRSRCIAAVLQGTEPGAMEVALEATKTGDAAGDGYGLHVLDLLAVGNGPVIVGCRCGSQHSLDPHKLRALAWEGQPGKPRILGVANARNTEGPSSP